MIGATESIQRPGTTPCVRRAEHRSAESPGGKVPTDGRRYGVDSEAQHKSLASVEPSIARQNPPAVECRPVVGATGLEGFGGAGIIVALYMLLWYNSIIIL